MNTREEFNEWWKTSSEFAHYTSKPEITKLAWQACQSLNDARIAELEEKLKVAEMDADRLSTLMNMSGEYYAESVKHQFVGRLQEFIDSHASEVRQAIDEAR